MSRCWFHRWEHVGFVADASGWLNIADPTERQRCAKCGLVQDRKVLP